jgi:pimeloyl-ACP methyl ester carboxylesterase
VDAQSAEAVSHAYDSRSAVSDALKHVLTRQPLPPSVREQAIADSLAAGDDARRAWPLQGLTRDITAAARAIEVPALVVAGQYDQVDPPASLEANLLPFIPGARMTVIEDTGHLSPLEVPGQVAHQIEEFASVVTFGQPADAWLATMESDG